MNFQENIIASFSSIITLPRRLILVTACLQKFWMCSGGPRGNHFTCPPGTSFDPDSKVGSCTGPPPVLVKSKPVTRTKVFDSKNIVEKLNSGFSLGKWQSWTTWSECSSTCGQGFKIRSRACLGERHHCQGKATQYETCPDNPECQVFREY